MGASLREAALDRWLDRAKPGELFIYHRGELGRDKQADPDLSALADKLLEKCAGRFDIVSRCGHVRGEIVGTGKVELVTLQREGGECVYAARMRAA
jgi:hypothetical protein